jgi:hypothetical protein
MTTLKKADAPRKLELDVLLDNNEDIYVRNNALKAQLLLVIAIKDKTGRNQTLKLPPTVLPMHVSGQFSRDSIRECSDLRRLIFNRTIILVDPSQARKELATTEAKEEMKALRMSVYADDAPTNAVRDTVEKLAKKSQAPVMNAADILNQKSQQDDVQLKVKGMIVSFQSKEKSSKETLVNLKRMKPALTESDLTFILSQCKAETTIREFAEQALAELSAAPEAPFDDAAPQYTQDEASE